MTAASRAAVVVSSRHWPDGEPLLFSPGTVAVINNELPGRRPFYRYDFNPGDTVVVVGPGPEPGQVVVRVSPHRVPPQWRGSQDDERLIHESYLNLSLGVL